MSLLQKKRVLYGCSPHAFKDKGGGEVLLLKSKRYLERLGFNVEVFDGSQPFAGFELFHNFNIHRDCFSTVKNANRAGLKVVISPVYWPSLRYVLFSKKPAAEKAKAVAASLLNRLDVFGTASAKKMLAMADVVTPSSLAEAAMLESLFKVPTRKIWVVHNGVEERFSKGKAKMFEEKFGLKDFALYVGRIEERKNLLSLVRAIKGTGKKLVVIGDVKHGSQAYFDKCKKEAGNNVLFLPGLPHDSKMLESAYAACRAFVLPSWYETPGLAALEAGLAKANIVVTREGPTKEYFAGFASYVNPGSVADIREKVLVEMQKPKSNALSRHIGKNFLWQNTAKETKQAYERAMEASQMKRRQGLVSIVILNWNGLDFTKKCIDSVRKKTGYAPYEIIVVDNGSSGKEVIELKKMHRKGLVDKLILNESNNGFSGGNNQGIKAAKGDYLLLLNNDTTLTKNWLTELVKTAEKDKKIGIVGPYIELYYQPGIVFGGGYVDDSGAARHSYSKEESNSEQVGGAALFFKREVLEKIGGLDEGFNPIYFEETDFCTRARKAGFRVVFTPKSKIVHFEGGIIEKQPSKWQYMTMNKNRQRYMLLHFSLWRLLKTIPWEILRIGKNLVNLRLHWLLEAYWITLKALPDILKRRARYKKGKLHAVKVT